ncbi:MAG: hypothetical protein HWE27_16145 [Gammaproteobacteria bacterium]|nr:hypothetical protein [Gammaproteobacteria bacterium]
MYRNVSKVLFPACVATVLVACGGGSGGGSGTPTPTTKTGVFMNGSVENIRYSTATQSGYTNSAGEFLYEDGETISFYVGDILLGSTAVAATLDLFDVSGASAPANGLETTQAWYSIGRDNPFNTVINYSVFLQTLDADSDLDNGISIPQTMHSVAALESLNFSLPADDFPEDFQLRKLIAEGRAQGLWGGSKQIRHPGLALDQLYSSLGLETHVYLPTGGFTDLDNDGVADANDNTYTYDATDNTWVYEYDNDADGIYDTTTTYDYNENSKQDTRISVSTLYSNYTVNHSYDADGNLIGLITDTSSDGVIDNSRAYEHDENGSLTVEQVDSNGDGALNYIRYYTYDSNGNKTIQENDSLADGSINQRLTYTYDSNNNLILEEWDQEPDGVIDITYEYTRDSNGNVTMREWDKDGDGVADDVRNYEYDSRGNLIVSEQDSDGDGAIDFRETREYDANNNRTLVERDTDGDGAINYRSESVFDSNGFIVGINRDTDGDGVLDVIHTYTNDSNGNFILGEYDDDGDGVVDRRYNAEYQIDQGSFNAYWLYWFDE